MINNDELRRRAEDASEHKGVLADDRESALPESTKAALHELRVHQIELEMQNDELSRMQLELEDSRALYFELYDLAPVAYCSVGEDGLVLEANLMASTLLGVDRGSLAGQLFSRFILQEDQGDYYLYRKELFGDRSRKTCELRMSRPDGLVFNARLASVIVQDGCGVPVCRIVITDITERKLAEAQIRRLLAEKELILKEVHHRMKNNMNAVMSLLSFQARTAGVPSAAAALTDAANRVHAMGSIYDKLFQSPDYSELSVFSYLDPLIGEVTANFARLKSVRIEKHIEDFILDVKRLQPVGIIVNELLTNIMKYAFTDDSDGIITVTASLAGGTVILSVADDGIGIPQSFDFGNSSGFGFTLIRALTEQLEGTVRIERGNGTKVILEFRL
jgi:PAS domain S-box-containing protein